MATYIMNFSLTQQGMQNAKDIPARVEAARKTVKSMGGEVKAFFGVLGADYDTMFILEAPDEASATKMALAISSLGNVRTSTHRAFSEEEFSQLLAELP